MRKLKSSPFWAIAMVAALGVGLSACGGDSDTAEAPPVVEPMPTPYETASAAIAAAATAAAAQAAYDAVKGDVTAAQGAMLQTKVDERVAALAMMDRAAAQKMALADAAGMVDTTGLETQAAIDAAKTAIAGLETALAAAADVSAADKAMYQGQVDAAETAVAAAQSVLDHATQTMALADAVGALQALDLSDLSTQAAIDAADAAVDALQAALDAATELSASEKTAAMTELAAASRIVMAAQGNVDTDSQAAMLANAVAALGMIDLDALMTQEQIDAANRAITELDLALAAATNLTDAEKLDATVDVTVAKRKVTDAEMVLAENVGEQRMALSDAGAALGEIDLDDLDTAEKITAANDAVEALKTALAAATHLSDAEKAMYQTQLDTATETVRTARTGMDRDGRMMAQRTAIETAVTAARTAVGMVNDDATDAQVTAADDAVAALKSAIDGAEDLPEGDTEVASAQGALDALMGVLASAKTSRMAAMDEEDRKQNAAMAATAAKLYVGIGAAPLTDHAVTVAATGVPSVDPAGDLAVQALTEDKKAMVAAHHGWTGKRWTASGADVSGTYEAVVYSNVGEPTEGDPFNEEYSSLTDGALSLVADGTGTGDFSAARVASSRFDQTAGTKSFKLGANDRAVMISGSYHGVPGTYSCTVVVGGSCTVTVAAQGFTLGGVDSDGTADTTVDWEFKPTSQTTKVMSMADAIYASYGWWLHTNADGDFTASAFAADRGEVPDAEGLAALNGTATYMGGAAGKYALRSSTDGTNDAGHFTADVTLDADFTDNTIAGTVDNFMGVGGAKGWSVELKESAIGDSGAITGTAADAAAGDQMTVWTIGGTAADASGAWSGSLQDNGDDNVPKVGTGTFHSTYGEAGRMVGAFGVTKQ